MGAVDSLMKRAVHGHHAGGDIIVGERVLEMGDTSAGTLSSAFTPRPSGSRDRPDPRQDGDARFCNAERIVAVSLVATA